MNNGDMPAAPVQIDDWHGLTKREDIAKHLMAALLTANDYDGTWTGLNAAADEAVSQTDALLAALEKS